MIWHSSLRGPRRFLIPVILKEHVVLRELKKGCSLVHVPHRAVWIPERSLRAFAGPRQSKWMSSAWPSPRSRCGTAGSWLRKRRLFPWPSNQSTECPRAICFWRALQCHPSRNKASYPGAVLLTGWRIRRLSLSKVLYCIGMSICIMLHSGSLSRLLPGCGHTSIIFGKCC